MQMLTLYEIDTRNTRFTLTIHGDPRTLCVARYWNQPRRSTASIVRTPTAPVQQWSGEVTATSMEAALAEAKAAIQGLDGPILACHESPLYFQARRMAAC